MLVAWVEKPDGALLPDGATTLAPGDRIGVVAGADDLPALSALAGTTPEEAPRRVAVFGAGLIGRFVAERLLDDARGAPGGLFGLFGGGRRRREVAVVDAITGPLRGRNVQSVHSVCNRRFEIVECGIQPGSPAAGRALRDLSAPGEYLLLLVRSPDAEAFEVPAGDTVLPALLFVGGCSGSTAGGVKVVRWTVLARQAAAETRRLLHPREVSAVRIDDRPVHDGLALGSLGPSANYGALPAALKWWYCLAMLAGRLEIYTMLILVGRLFFSRAR